MILKVSLSDEDRDSIASAVFSKLSPHLQQKQEAPANEPPLKIGEVSKMFGVSKTSIHEWCKSGKLPHFHVGRRLYFPRHAIQLIASGSKKGGGR